MFVHDLLSDACIREWKLDISEKEFCAELKDRSIRGVVSLLMTKYTEREGAYRWGEKTPQHLLFVKEIKSVFPKAKFVHILRDGRDVAVSSRRVPVGPPSIYGIAKEWIRYVRAFEQLKSDLAPDEWLDVRYENLVQNTNSELARIFSFLGETPTQVGTEVPLSNSKKYYVNLGDHMHSLTKSISTSKIGGYKNTFSNRELMVFEHVAAGALQSYGYPPVAKGDTKIAITVGERLKFCLLDNVYRYLRKYCRPSQPAKVWFLFKSESQRCIRRYIRLFAPGVRSKRILTDY